MRQDRISAPQNHHPRRIAALSLICALALGLYATSDLRAQEAAPYTLHVYANLMQIPVLILGPGLDDVPRFDPAKLTVSIDGGAPFHPAHVRPEGDDPLALAILLDTGDGDNDLLPQFSKAIVKAATKALHPQDNIAVYSLNCVLSPVSAFAPADPAVLKAAADQAAEAVKQHAPCDHLPLHLRDALAILTTKFSDQRGRRVLLALSVGRDSGSTLNEAQLRAYATDAGVAIFGLAPARQSESEVSLFKATNSRLESVAPADPNFDLLCRDSGGIARVAGPDSLTSGLTDIFTMLRNRIIIEFPRPKDSTPGFHHVIAVGLPKVNAYIHPAGISLPISDSHTFSDSKTIRPENSPPQ